MKYAFALLTISLVLQARALPEHWVCGPFKPNTGNPIIKIDYLKNTDELVLTLEEDWKKSYGTLPKGKYVTPSHPSNSGASRYVHMDVTSHFPHPKKPEVRGYLTFSLSYTATAFISEIYVQYDDPENPYTANQIAEFLCEAF